MRKQLLILFAICSIAYTDLKAQTIHERITMGTGEYDPNASWHGILRFENSENYNSNTGTSYTPDGIVPVKNCSFQSVSLNFVHGMYLRENSDELYVSTLFTNQNNVLTTDPLVAVGAIDVFSNASSLNGATTPARHIFGNLTQLVQPHGLFVDTLNDRIYVANTFADNILVFNNASTATGNIAPDRVITYSSTMGAPVNIHVDIATDRIFVSCMPSMMGGFNQPEICIFNNASTINGSVPPDVRILGTNCRFMIRNQTVHNVFFNPVNKLLAVGHHTNELLIFDLSTQNLSPSSPTVLNLVPRVLLINEIAGTVPVNDTLNHNLYGFFWDIATDKIYISDGYTGGSPGQSGGPTPGTLNKIKIYSNLSSSATAGMVAPDRVISWTNSTSYWPPQPIWVTKTISTGVENYYNISSVQVYPNPASSVINIDYKDFRESVLSITVLDMLGREVLSQFNDFDKVDVSQLKSGIYFIVINGETNKINRGIAIHNE